MQKSELGLFAVLLLSSFSFELYGLSLIPAYVITGISMFCGIMFVIFMGQMRTAYGNDLFLKTLTKAKTENITITVTNATCPHCGGNILEDPLP